MKKKNFYCCRFTLKVMLSFIISLGTIAGAYAQSVSGVVTTTYNETVIGASVLVEGTTKGTVTDVDGKFELTNVGPNATIVFSYIGMKTQKVAVNGRNIINVVMEDESILVEETVVIGYGSVKKSDLTGAVSVVKPDDFKNKTNNSIGDMLQGAAAGVSVRSTGEIGAVPSIQIAVQAT